MTTGVGPRFVSTYLSNPKDDNTNSDAMGDIYALEYRQPISLKTTMRKINNLQIA